MYLFNYQVCWKICCLIAIVVSSGRTSIQISSQLCLVYVMGSVLAPFLFAVFLNELSNTCNLDSNRFIIVYADDILLISPSVVNLENLIHLCERELNWLDMTINYKKYCCLRIEPRCDVSCANIISSTGQVLPWTNVIRYLRIFIVQSRTSSALQTKRNVSSTERLMLFSAKQADLLLKKLHFIC